MRCYIEGGNKMQKWEYKVLDAENAFYYSRADEEIANKLNKLGKEGWELVGYATFNVHMFVLKRKIDEENNPELGSVPGSV
jgi:hypothetical protein